MKHLEQEELVLLYYGEHPAAGTARTHVDGCDRCGAAFRGLESLLDGIRPEPVPQRGEGYGRQVWAAIEPRLDPPRVGLRSWWTLPRMGLAAGVAMLLLFSFLFGRISGRAEGMQALSADARERILMQAVGEHLERSERALVELTNVEAGPSVDIGSQRERAARLASANRLYRASAEHAGRSSMVALLDELERVLLEIANTPDTPDAAELERLSRRVEASGLRFKLKLMGTETRQRAAPPASAEDRT